LVSNRVRLAHVILIGGRAPPRLANSCALYCDVDRSMGK